MTMWLNAPPKIDRPLPVWEHGYRCHGYWLRDTPSETPQRMGHVGLTLPGRFPRVYSWALDATDDRGECTTLRAAKRRVEAMFRERYSWRFPASRGH